MVRCLACVVRWQVLIVSRCVIPFASAAPTYPRILKILCFTGIILNSLRAFLVHTYVAASYVDKEVCIYYCSNSTVLALSGEQRSYVSLSHNRSAHVTAFTVPYRPLNGDNFLHAVSVLLSISALSLSRPTSEACILHRLLHRLGT